MSFNVVELYLLNNVMCTCNRNNLTVLEIAQLSGTGAHAQFKFGNRKPGSTTPLLFELTDKHLKDCESKCSVQ